ncbi:hypothetical protein [Methylobacterium sp. A54F]|jgi:hypothetical protein
MRATLFGLATIAGLALTAPASALPGPGGPLVAPAAPIAQARVVERRIVRGPRCTTVVTKRRGPMGRTVIVRKRRCF